MDVRGLMYRSFRFWGDHEAIVSGSRRLTFSEAWERGTRLANALLALGLNPGDRIAVLEDNELGAADFFLACTIANLVRVPLYPRNARESHIHMIGHTGCRAVMVNPNYAHEMEGLLQEVPSLEQVITRDDSYEELLAGHSNEDPKVPIDENDYYIIRHTAGTTGRSKGVAYTHRTWLATARDWFFSYPPIELGDACLHLGPISHGSGYFFTPIWICGGRNILVPKFDVVAALDIMEEEHVAFMWAVPTIVRALVRHPSARNRDFSSLKALVIGGSPITEATARFAHEVFGDSLFQLFGQTEVLPATNISSREWFSEIPGSNPLRSAGRPFPFVEVDILDVETHKPLPTGEEGVIAVRSDGQMKGFWEDEEGTRERVIDGWVITGDVGRFDNNGYLYVLDRANDMIISGGFNIYPAELENAIGEHPSVAEVAVFAIPDERWGETPAAHVVVDDLSSITEQEVIALVVERLGSYKKPSKVVLTTDPLPKSPVGKILRKALRDPYWVGMQRRIGGA